MLQQHKSKILKSILILTLLCALPLIIWVSAGDVKISLLSDEAQAKLELQISELITKCSLSNAKIGVKVISTDKNKLVYQKNNSMPLIPASNMKLFTTGTALCLLGPDFQHETTLYRIGPTINNVLKSDLIIKSNGNPNISGRFYNGNTTAVFEEWALILRRLGVKKIQGDIILDDSAFDRQHLITSWPSDQLSYWYCAPISAISFNDNCIDITVYQDKEKDKVSYYTNPGTKYVTIINNCQETTRKSRHLINIIRGINTNTITINGSFYYNASPYKESITVTNPALYFGNVFKETLIHKKGIIVIGNIKLTDKAYDIEQDNLIELASNKTDLLTTINVTNKNSQNFYSEQILKTLSYHFLGRGTFKDGIIQVNKFLKDNKILTNPESFIQADGSGLSRENRLTPEQITNLLFFLSKHKYYNQFKSTLPISGVDGGMKNRLEGLKGKIHAKTGYINGVSALSGYIKTNSSKNFAFSIILNELPQKSKPKQFQDELIKLLIKL